MSKDAPFRLMVVGGPGDAPGRDFVEVMARAVDGGVDAVQVRDRSLGGKELYELVSRIVDTVGSRARVMVNDRVDVALAAGASGIHLPASGMVVADARRLVGPGRLIGRSAHGVVEAERAEADYVIFGPVYETASKKVFGAPRGIEELRDTVAAVEVPVYAIGGITPERAGQVRDTGAAGMAVMSFILGHREPEKAAKALLENWMRGECAGEGARAPMR